MRGNWIEFCSINTFFLPAFSAYWPHTHTHSEDNFSHPKRNWWSNAQGWWNACVAVPRVRCMLWQSATGRGSTSKSPTCSLSFFRFRNIYIGNVYDALRYSLMHMHSAKRTERRQSGGGRNMHSHWFLLPYVLLGTEYSSFFFIRFWRFSLFFFLLFSSFIFSCLSMRSIYGTFMQARTNFSTIKGPAGFELTIILTSNLLHSQSNSFVGVVWCALVWKITVASKTNIRFLTKNVRVSKFVSQAHKTLRVKNYVSSTLIFLLVQSRNSERKRNIRTVINQVVALFFYLRFDTVLQHI